MVITFVVFTHRGHFNDHLIPCFNNSQVQCGASLQQHCRAYHISDFHYIKWSSGIAGQTRYNRGLYFLKMDHSVISIQFVCKTYVTYLYACQNMLPKSFQTCPSSATAIPNSLTMYHFNSACFENRHSCLFDQLLYNVHKWEHITYMYQTNCHTLHTAAPEHFKTNN